jgi:hypothetical protein
MVVYMLDGDVVEQLCDALAYCCDTLTKISESENVQPAAIRVAIWGADAALKRAIEEMAG